MKPYYDEDGVTLYHGDMREITPTLALEPFTTITDPPYGQTSLAWDRWVDGWPTLIGSAEMWCFGSMRMFLDHADDFCSWKFGQDVVWEKHNGSSFHADRFRRTHESVVQFYRGPWLNLGRHTPTTLDAVRKTVKRKKDRPAHMGEIEGSTFTSYDGGPRLMTTVLKVRSCHGEAVHPTQKPLGIIDPLIRYSVPPTFAVFDPFAGAGSVLLAAKLLGRSAIGIEADERYCELAVNRLAQGVLAL